MRVEPIDTSAADWLDDPRLAVYRMVRDPERVRRGGDFLAEGRLVVRTLLTRSSLDARSVLATAAACAWLRTAVGPHARDLPVYLVSAAAMRALAGQRFHQGCLAAGRRPPPRSPADLLRGLPPAANRVVALDGVTNPDNVGAIFRSAAAFGVKAVVLSPDCCSPLYRKAIRTSMGAALTVPFAHGAPWDDALDALRDGGYRLLALTPREDATSLDDVRGRIFPGEAKLALLLGAEGHGLGAPSLAAAHDRVRIPIAERVDSLNVAATAAIALFALRPGAARD